MHSRYLKERKEKSSTKGIFFFEFKFSPRLTGFLKNHSTQNVLLNMIDKWKHALDKGRKVDALFIDLSKAFDTLNHNLLLAKCVCLFFQCAKICSILFVGIISKGRYKQGIIYL